MKDLALEDFSVEEESEEDLTEEDLSEEIFYEEEVECFDLEEEEDFYEEDEDCNIVVPQITQQTNSDEGVGISCLTSREIAKKSGKGIFYTSESIGSRYSL